MTPNALDSAMDNMAAGMKFFPKTPGERAAISAELERIIPPVAIEKKASAGPNNCPSCCGIGFVTIEKNGLSAAKRCACTPEPYEVRVSDDEQLEWLSRRMIQLFREWPGCREMRAVYCWRFKMPADGFAVISEAFPDGVIPEERTESIQIAAGPVPKRLTAGEASADQELESTVVALAEKVRFNAAQSPTRRKSLKELEEELAAEVAQGKAKETIQ